MKDVNSFPVGRIRVALFGLCEDLKLGFEVREHCFNLFNCSDIGLEAEDFGFLCFNDFWILIEYEKTYNLGFEVQSGHCLINCCWFVIHLFKFDQDYCWTYFQIFVIYLCRCVLDHLLLHIENDFIVFYPGNLNALHKNY